MLDSVPGPASADHGLAFEEGQRLASETGRPPSSADLLVGMLRAGGAAARFLAERGLTGAKVDRALAGLRHEPNFDLGALKQASVSIAETVGARQLSSIHLLLALLRGGGSAVELLRATGQDPTKLRAVILRGLTGPSRSAERSARRDPSAEGEPPAEARPVAAPPAAVSAARMVPRTRTTPPPPPASRAGAAPLVPRLAPVRAVPAAAPARQEEDFFPLEPPRSPVLHRDRELGRLLDLLQVQATGRILCVVGDPGSGRSALLAALSAASAEKPLVPAEAAPSGMSVGAWLSDLHRRAPLPAPVVLDGISLGGEGGDGPAALLATARAGRRWILTATPADLRRYEAMAPELVTTFETVVLSPLPPEGLVEVLEAGLEAITASTGVEFAPDVCKSLVRLAWRYPSERSQPGRSLTIAEITAARAARLDRPQVTDTEIAEVVAAAADVPATRLLRTDDERFRTLETRLSERVVGHDDARARISDVLRRSYAGFRGRRPLASLLLLGPTGVGKTETARAIADALFDGDAALLRIDLSEYSEPHAVSRLIGSPPGYVGYEEGGQLTEGIRRRPASVVLLDELEKAHREVLLLLLQVLEDGRLTDGRGRTVDFSAAAIVMTSNLGSECYRRSRNPALTTITGIARSRLPPELWNRIDEVLCYAPLAERELASIVGRIAIDSSRRLESERGIQFSIDDSVIKYLLAAEPDRTLGARPLRRAFERLVEGPLANEILAGNLRRGASLKLHATASGKLTMSYGR